MQVRVFITDYSNIFSKYGKIVVFFMFFNKLDFLIATLTIIKMVLKQCHYLFKDFPFSPLLQLLSSFWYPSSFYRVFRIPTPNMVHFGEVLSPLYQRWGEETKKNK